MSLSNNQLKLITSLRRKKYRNLHKLFIVEGIKGVEEFLNSSFQLHSLFTTDESIFQSYSSTAISETELSQISALKSPNKVLGIFKIPEEKELELKDLTIALDDINDPGNLGTIIRLCDWFGVQNLICSLHTVDCYNPKVVQASMGSLTRVSIHYVHLSDFLKKSTIPIITADMDGKSVYEFSPPKQSILIMGNEANGISNEVEFLANEVISIPRFGMQKETESLNVATATAILLNEFRRKLS